MIDLEKISGLPVEVMDDYHLKFKPPLKDFSLTFARKFSEMVPALLDPETKPAMEETYFVYRGIYLPEQESLVKTHHLTYDITIIPAIKLGREFNRTVGHYHANKPGLSLAHPELYEVLHGEGLFILQKMDDNFENVLDVIVVEAKTGEKIIYPPNYGHVIVNIGSDILVTANWCSTDYKPLYEIVTKYHGLAYYVIDSKQQQFEFVPNINYKQHPKIRFLDQHELLASKFGFTASEPMYITGTKNPQKLDFLGNPENHTVELSALTT